MVEGVSVEDDHSIASAKGQPRRRPSLVAIFVNVIFVASAVRPFIGSGGGGGGDMLALLADRATKWLLHHHRDKRRVKVCQRTKKTSSANRQGRAL